MLQGMYIVQGLNLPHCDKTGHQGFGESATQTSLLSYRNYLENRNSACGKSRYTVELQWLEQAWNHKNSSSQGYFQPSKMDYV